MQLVRNNYYFLYNRISRLLSVLLIVLTVLAWTVPAAAVLKHDWGFTPMLLVIAGAQLAYSFLLFKREANNNIWIASLVNSMILTLAWISLIHNSGQLHSLLVIGWVLHIMFSGMFGLYALVASDFIITAYYVIVSTGPDKHPLDPVALGAVFGTIAASLVSYLLWKRTYIDTENQRITQLTGQLRGEQQQAEILIQSIGDGIIVTDNEGKISLLNAAASKLTGWPIDEALGIDAKLVIKLQLEDGKDLDDSLNPFKLVAKTNETADATLRLVDRVNNFVIVSVVVSPVISPGDKQASGLIAVFRDVSAARQEEHRRADFISTASHEMRTPVAAIEGYLALALNDKVSRIDSKARTYLVKAHESTQHLGKLFQDLLTSAKAEDGRLVSHPQVVEMGAFLQEVTDGLRFSAEKKGLLLDFTLGAAQDSGASAAGGKVVAPLYYAHIDPDRMREVITNVFDNAVKYTETGKITVALTGNDQVVQLFIKDTGPGIPPEDLPHLFQKFYRVDSSATRTIGGTGLGLFICKKIVELYKGRIWVESTVGQGSTFYINVPRLDSQRAQELQKTEATEKLQI